MFTPLFKDKNIFSELKRPVMFEDGVGAVLDNNQNNKFVFPILKGDPSSLSYNPSAPSRAETGIASGQQLTLVAGYQTQYN